MYKLKNLFKEWYQPHEKFVVRSPLFPTDVFFEWTGGAGVNGEKSKEKLRESLKQFYLQPIAQEALYVASPDLYQQLLLWLEDKIEKPDRREKAELSLVKYMIRMCTRCTPYGLFASCTNGRFSDSTEFILKDKMFLERYPGLDMDYLCELHTHLLRQIDICDQLLFFPNTSLYRTGDAWRYLEYRFQKEVGRSYHVVEIGHSEFLEKVLNVAKYGARITDLAATIINDEVNLEHAVDFVYELINNQVLVDEMQPSVAGQEYFSILLSKLKTLQYTEKYCEQLEFVSRQFEQLRKAVDTDKSPCYKEISRSLGELDIPIDAKMLIQIDSYRPASCSLNEKLADQVLKGASVLQVLAGVNTPKDPFAEFKTLFTNRYEGQWVPLNEALDPERGIGYGKFANSGLEESPLIDNLKIKNETKTEVVAEPEFFKWQLCQHALSHHTREVKIDDSLLERLATQKVSPDSLPGSISMLAKIYSADQTEIDSGSYHILLQPPFGPSGGNLLSRFCRLKNGMEELVRAILESEEEQDKESIFAEIVHPRIKGWEYPDAATTSQI